VLRLICAVLGSHPSSLPHRTRIWSVVIIGWSLEERSSSAPVQNPEARFSSVRPCDHADTKPCEVTRRVAAGYPYFWNLVATFSSRKQALWRPLTPFESKRLIGRSLTRTKLFGAQTVSISDVLVKELRTYHCRRSDYRLYETWSSSPKSRCANLIELWHSIHSLRDFGGYHDWVERFDEAHFHIPRVKGGCMIPPRMARIKKSSSWPKKQESYCTSYWYSRTSCVQPGMGSVRCGVKMFEFVSGTLGGEQHFDAKALTT
jgi:hypothetical protein